VEILSANAENETCKNYVVLLALNFYGVPKIRMPIGSACRPAGSVSIFLSLSGALRSLIYTHTRTRGLELAVCTCPRLCGSRLITEHQHSSLDDAIYECAPVQPSFFFPFFSPPPPPPTKRTHISRRLHPFLYWCCGEGGRRVRERQTLLV